ncbi:uncharacterized protein LOC132809079 [Hemiscyllium ocellatum]|uniref:uncharacterized protein LOC132809079 n=1 Tax=Hemiscyllium ocellatum TaxID=170820 RepID=UPI0029660AEB|nr:uncharacterized protein LOC132809079 [Hemiscyllium ocellatum]
MRWEASRYGDLTVAQIDQSLDDGPYIHPAYQDRLSLVSHGPESLLHFDPVQEQDFGEYLCKGQVVGQEGETFTSLSILAEDTRPDLETPDSERANATMAPEVISLNSSGRVTARLGQRAELECRIESGQPGVPVLAVEWGSAAGDVVLSRVDQADPSANYLDPRYRQRLTVSFLGNSARLIFRAVRQEDYGEYLCKAWVSGHPEHSLTASTSLEEELPPVLPSNPAPQQREREQAPSARVVSVNTPERVSARLGSPATLSCQAMAVHAGPETRYRLSWSAQRLPNLTLAQLDQGEEGSGLARVHPGYRHRLSMTAHGASSQLHFRTVTESDPGVYLCKAGISGRSSTEDLSSPVLLVKANQKILPASSETAILWLILHFFVVLFAMAIGVGSCFLTGTKNRILPEHV